MTSSVLSDGAGTKTLTEPLLMYLSQGGAVIVQQTAAGSWLYALFRSQY